MQFKAIERNLRREDVVGLAYPHSVGGWYHFCEETRSTAAKQKDKKIGLICVIEVA
jgi:hypothetical protein